MYQKRFWKWQEGARTIYRRTFADCKPSVLFELPLQPLGARASWQASSDPSASLLKPFSGQYQCQVSQSKGLQKLSDAGQDSRHKLTLIN